MLLHAKHALALGRILQLTTVARIPYAAEGFQPWLRLYDEYIFTPQLQLKRAIETMWSS